MELSRSAGTSTHPCARVYTCSKISRNTRTHTHTHSTRMINLSINGPISCGEPSSFPCEVPVSRNESLQDWCAHVTLSSCVFDLCNQSLFKTFSHTILLEHGRNAERCILILHRFHSKQFRVYSMSFSVRGDQEKTDCPKGS